MIRVVIAEDEPLARRGLRGLLERSGLVEVIAECADGPATVKAIRSLQPDLVFLDIQMPDLDGFGVLRQLSGKNRPLVVFVTAYDQYAVDAFEVSAVDYLLKPFEWSRVAQTLDKARLMLRTRAIGLLAEPAGEGETGSPIIEVPDSGGVARLGITDIIWIEARGNYLRIHATTGGYLLREPLSSLTSRLSDSGILRVSRSSAVNLYHVIRLAQEEGRLIFHLSAGHEVPVSRRYRQVVEEELALLNA